MIIGFMLIAMGICGITYMPRDAENLGVGIVLIVLGGMIVWTFADMKKPRTIDVSVKNKIVAQDGQGRYLVEAKTSRQIIGPAPHTTDNLPAHLYQVKKGLWIVDNNTSTVMGPDEEKNIKWEPVSCNKSIEPRGNSHSEGFLMDQMNGYSHNYIKDNDNE